MDKVDVLYTVNHQYVKYMLVSLYSILENNKDIHIVIHIVQDKFELEDYKIIESIINSFNNVDVYFYNFEEINKNMIAYNIPCWRGTQIANARVFFNSYVKKANKLLYLDSDTVVVNSLADLNKYDGTIYMVEDSMPIDFWQNLTVPLKKYCNSGVFWVDVQKWNENDCDKKIETILNQNIPLTFPDQDLLNMALKDDIQLLPPNYNIFSTDYYFNKISLKRYYGITNIKRYSIDKIIEAKKNPIILHSTPFYSHRPFEDNNIHPYSKIYNEYFQKLYGETKNNNNMFEELLFKFYLGMNLLCPPKVKETVKKFIKK